MRKSYLQLHFKDLTLLSAGWLLCWFLGSALGSRDYRRLVVVGDLRWQIVAVQWNSVLRGFPVVVLVVGRAELRHRRTFRRRRIED